MTEARQRPLPPEMVEQADLGDLLVAARYVMESTPGMTWCAQCGPHIKVDEDGCCKMCGATSVGDGADMAVEVLVESERVRQRCAKLETENESLRSENTRLRA